jgi:hypothetical protein
MLTRETEKRRGVSPLVFFLPIERSSNAFFTLPVLE